MGLWSHRGPSRVCSRRPRNWTASGGWNFPKGGQKSFNKLPRRSFPLLSPVECFCSGPVQCVAHSREEFFVIERLHKKCDRANGHGGGPRGQIFTRSDDNDFCAR